MNKLISLVVGVLAVVSLALGFAAYSKPAVVEKSVVNQVGASVGPDTYFDYVSNNAYREYARTIPFAAATNTVCAIKSPEATSTLVFGSAVFTVSSTTASVVTLAQSSSPSASTTPLTIAAISANAQGTVMASTTPLLSTGLINNLVFGPNTFFTVNMSGGIGTFSPSGTCSAQFIRN